MKLLFVFSCIGSIIVLFLVIPLMSFLLSLRIDYVVTYGFDTEAVHALFIGMIASSVSTMLSLLFGVPLSYVLARRDFYGKGIVESIIDVPFLIPHGIAGIVVLIAYNSRAPLGSVLANLSMKVEDSFWGIVFAMLFVSVPIVVDTVREGFKLVPPDVEYVARSLGASEWYTFSRVTLPIISKHLVVASLLCWARGMSEVGAILVVAYYPKSINVLIMERFWTYGLEVAKATAFPLLVISLLIFVVIRRIVGGLR